MNLTKQSLTNYLKTLAVSTTSPFICVDLRRVGRHLTPRAAQSRGST